MTTNHTDRMSNEQNEVERRKSAAGTKMHKQYILL